MHFREERTVGPCKSYLGDQLDNQKRLEGFVPGVTEISFFPPAGNYKTWDDPETLYTGVIKGIENGSCGLMWLEVCDVTVDTNKPESTESYPVCESDSMILHLAPFGLSR